MAIDQRNDQRSISSTLRTMDDTALKNYGLLHKSNPFIFPLVFQESQDRQHMRNAQQMQGGQEQPKVVDQALAQMAPRPVQPMPEDMGIGQLNAGNMNFAGGGIIAFADGGDVERYQSGGITAKYQQESMEMGMGTRMQYSPEVQAYAQAQEQASKASYADRERAQMLQGPYSRTAAPAPAVPVALAAPPADYDPTENLKKIAQTNAKYVAASAPKSAEEAALLGRYPTNKPKADGAAPTADTTRKAPAAGLGAAAAAKAVPEQSTAERYLQMQRDMGLGPESRDDVDKKRTEMEASKRAQVKGALEEFEKDVAARGEAFKGREERLAKREAGLGKMKDETTGLALLEAGLGIMSTPGGLAAALGKGAQAGLKTYGAGLEKLRSAQEKMDDARDQIEEFRRNEANMTAKERRQYKNDIARTETEIKQLGVEAAEKMYGYKREDAKSVFAASTQERLTDKEIASRERISATELAARERIAQLPQGNERIASLLGNGDLAKGLAKFAEIQAGKFNPTTAYTDYISKRKEGDTVLTPQEFVTQIRSIQALMAGAPSVSNKPTGKAFE